MPQRVKVFNKKIRHKGIFQDEVSKAQLVLLSPRRLLAKLCFSLVVISYINQITCHFLIISGFFLFQTRSLRAMEQENPGDQPKNTTLWSLKPPLSPVRENNQLPPNWELRTVSQHRSTSFSDTEKRLAEKTEGRGLDQPNSKGIQSSPDREMEEDDQDPSNNKEEKLNICSFYKDNHPLTLPFWKKLDLSDRLKKIWFYIKDEKENIIKDGVLLASLIDRYFEKFKTILQCLPEDNNPIQALPEIHYEDLIIGSDKSKNVSNGRSGAEVSILFCGAPKVKVVVKKIKDIKKALEELFLSLFALAMNPDPEKIKMARVYDAVLCPGNCLSIIMEGANKKSINDYLQSNLAEPAVTACAKHMAESHVKHYQRISNDINGDRYLEHASGVFHRLSYNPLTDAERKELGLLPLVYGIQLEYLKNKTEVKSNKIIRLLTQEEQKKFADLVTNVQHCFEKNSTKIYQLFKSGISLDKIFYFLTFPHGDAHLANYFFEKAKRLMKDGSAISQDSSLRITEIDFATIMEGIDDPAKDVGRFLGSLREYAAQHDDEKQGIGINERISNLQKKFVQTYFNTVRESKIFTEENQKIFEEIFKENWKFHELRLFKVIANSEQSTDIKLKILKSWIKENSGIEPSPQENSQQDSPKKKSPSRRREALVAEIKYYLPDQPSEFIEASPQGSNKSYLALLRERLDCSLSSIVTIVGMGGVGKTSLASKYACASALEKSVYTFIYWVKSSSESFLLKSYKNLLRELGVSTKGADDKKIIDLIKQYVPKRSLIIYDNAPDSDFLSNKMPEDSHIVITSRCNKGWNGVALNLDVLRPEDSIKYLLQITGFEKNPENEKRARKLAEELGHLPLALKQAAHYMKLSGTSFEQYLQKLRKKTLFSFEEHQNPFKKLEITYESFVDETLRISTEEISELARKILVVCAFLEPDSIAEKIFPEYAEDKEKFERALSQLASLSLIKRAQKEPIFSIHRLVQLVTRNNRDLTNKYSKEISMLARMLGKKIIDNAENYNFLLNYLGHGIKLSKHLECLETFPTKVKKLELAISVPFCQGMVSEATRAKRAELPAKVLKRLTEAAECGSRVAQFNLGWIAEGQGDVESVIKWYEKAAQQDHVHAQYFFGMFLEDQGNEQEALKWYRRAAEQEDKDAQFRLGMVYEDQGDYTEAIKFYFRSSNNGDLEAPLHLGKIYKKQGDVKRAIKCFNKAANNGALEALLYLGKIYKKQGDVKRAIKWFNEAAKEEDKNALAYLMRYAQNGHKEAQFCVGQMCVVVEDDAEAIRWFFEASKKGHRDARVALTSYAKVRHEEAQFNLGWLYANGFRGKTDNTKASQWFIKAAKQGHPEAQRALSI